MDKVKDKDAKHKVLSAAVATVRTQPPRKLGANATQAASRCLCTCLAPSHSCRFRPLLAHLMDNCPNEILGLIFEEACTDDGLTGRSLSLVSRHIHHASRRYAFQSIALYGSRQLSAFASLLDKANLEDFRVRHLYITDHRRVWKDTEQRLKECVTKDFHINDPSREISSSAILRIFKAASRNLQTLALLLFDQHAEQLLSDAMSFPNLRELTIHGSGMAHNVQSELPQCLSLRRLHIIQDHSFKRLIAQFVSRLAPLLTHLRFSRLLSGMIMPINLERDLRCMLHPSNAVDATFPQTLERVLVQMLRRSFPDSDGGQDALLVSSLALRAAAVANRQSPPQLGTKF